MSTGYVDIPGGVTHINNLSGDITIVAGPGITIGNVGNVITVSNNIVRPYYALWNRATDQDYAVGQNLITWENPEYDPDGLLTSGTDFIIPLDYPGTAVCQATMAFQIKDGAAAFQSRWVLYQNFTQVKTTSQSIQDLSIGANIGGIHGCIDFIGVAGDVFQLYTEANDHFTQLDGSQNNWISFKILPQQS